MNAQSIKGVYYPTSGKHSLHNQSNDNGLKLINFAASTGMVIGSTLFQHRDIHKGTWKSPDGQIVNQIDHVLIDMRHKSNLMDMRSFRGANIDSDHFLVVSKLRARLANYKKECGTGVRKYNVDKFKND
jgi:hypothetical protein